MPTRRITALLALTLTTTLVLTACSNFRFPGVYRIDITQGNFVTEDMINQLQPGMTPEQVRYIMGHPTLVDPFTPNIWFYPMIFRPGARDEVIRQDITIYFDEGRYSHYEGTLLEDFKNKTSGHKDRELQQKAVQKLREAELKRVDQPAAPEASPETQPSPENDTPAERDANAL